MLATCLLEGASYGARLSNPGRYSHDEGMYTIAMESAQELVKLYESIDYAMDDVVFAHHVATQESASEEVLEGIGGKIKSIAASALTKIREFMIKLKEKVMTFFHNVKRFLDGISKSGEAFATKYEKDLRALNLTGYEVETYDFSNIDADVKKGLKSMFDKIVPNFNGMINLIEAKTKKIANYKKGDPKETDYYADGEKSATVINQKKDFARDVLPKGMSYDDINQDEITQAAVNRFLGGDYSSKSEPNVVKYRVDIGKVIDALKGTSATYNAIEDIRKGIDGKYEEIIKKLDACENIVSKTEDFPNLASNIRAYSAIVSKAQNVLNAHVTAAKNCISMRNAAYKKIVTGAFAYARKNGKSTEK